MGPSGSGKTTLLSILGCMLAPTAGTVRVCGTPTAGARPEELAEIRRHHIGFVFQAYHLFSTLTVLENVLLALDVRGEHGPHAVRKSEEILASVGLGAKMKSFPRQLSGGEQQRVAIARAIVAEPSAILADEPTASLDSANGHVTTGILSTIARERGRAVLVVTHDQRLFEFADRVVNIVDGTLTEEELDELSPRRRNGSSGQQFMSDGNVGRRLPAHGAPSACGRVTGRSQISTRHHPRGPGRRAGEWQTASLGRSAVRYLM
jgi:putative ABC transport system ATP-binding protein